MSTSSSNCCDWCKRHSGNLPPISHLPNPTPEQARQIADLDANIQSTDDYIQALIKRRATLSRKRNALVPAVNLPTEVLTTIFEIACCPINSDPNRDHRIVKVFQEPFWSISTSKQYNCGCTTTPTVIGAVCSAWRNIAIETSQLWSNIKIAFNDANSDAQATKLRYWISKSGQRPLTVSLVEERDEDDEDRGIWRTDVLDVLEEYAHRLQTLDMFLPEAWKLKPAIMALIANRLPLLTSVTLRPGTGLQGMQNFDLFAHAPQLREVRLFDCSTATVSLPLAQLERLEVVTGGNLSMVHECLERLDLCPRLRSYTTYINGKVLNFVPVLWPMTHTKLEVIELMDRSVTQADIHAFLGESTLPMLRSFSLYIRAKDPLTGIPSLLPFLSRSAGKLETLCLAGQLPLEEQLLGCLQVLPQLRKLVLNNRSHKNTNLTQRTLDRMNPTKYDEEGARRCLAPNLETFYYHGSIEPTPHALVEFLADRWRGPSAARTSRHDVEFPPGVGLEARAALERRRPRVNAPLTRLRSVAFITMARFNRPDKPGILFDDADTAVLQRLQQEGMSMVF
ncbi:hypothetical protein BJ912DRAFT_94983 [Pholiota molesta]|nr:hypothetical protein BJ912DRAFT_94983 [Pholiota molesta]